MARPRLHDTDRLLDAAVQVILNGGVGAATVEAVSAATGAPSGTIYNRFGSREGMVRAAWIRAARRSQSLFLEAIAAAETPRQAALAAGLSILTFSQRHLADAQLLVNVRRRDLLNPDSEEGIEDMTRPIVAAIRELARELTGRASVGAVQTVTLATVDIPHGAVRHYLKAGKRPPKTLTRATTAAIAAVLDTLERDGP